MEMVTSEKKVLLQLLIEQESASNSLKLVTVLMEKDVNSLIILKGIFIFYF